MKGGVKISGWLVPALLLCTVAYALAEDLTLTTYYPSPRGVYKELRTSGDAAIGTTGTPVARLQVVGAGGIQHPLRVEAPNGIATPFEINSDGYVGIGTDNPPNLLSLKSAINTAQIRLEQNNTTDAWTLFADSGGGRFRLSRTGTGAGEKLTILQDGSVGIGTANPGQKLEVNGVIKATDVLVGSNSVVTQVQCAGGMTCNTSGNILTISGAPGTTCYQHYWYLSGNCAGNLWCEYDTNGMLQRMTHDGNMTCKTCPNTKAEAVQEGYTLQSGSCP